jgi:hypothetical protein
LTGAEVLDEPTCPFFGALGVAWDNGMVARWSANRLGMLWPEVETPGHQEFTAKCASLLTGHQRRSRVQAVIQAKGRDGDHRLLYGPRRPGGR